MHIERLAHAAVAVIGALCLVPTSGYAQAIAITNVTVIDASGAPPQPGATVLMEDERISAIGRSVAVPAGAEVLDGTGKFLIPGMADMHVHLGDYASASAALGRLAASGITTVRDMGSPPEDMVRLRREIVEANLIAPRLVVAGPILQGALPFQAPPMIRTIASPDEARAAVDDLWAQGAIS